VGDGNCLFQTLCYIITGSEEQHLALRAAIACHMLSIPHLFVGHGPDGQPNCITLMYHPCHYDSVEDYIQESGMDCDTTWGTSVEMACLAHMFRTPVYCYDASHIIIYGLLIFSILLTDQFLEILGIDLFIFIYLIIILK